MLERQVRVSLREQSPAGSRRAKIEKNGLRSLLLKKTANFLEKMNGKFNEIFIENSKTRSEFLKWVCSESERLKEFSRSTIELRNLFDEWKKENNQTV